MHNALQDFAKAGAVKWLMPVWREDELIAAGRHLYNLSEDTVCDLYAKWGGSARYVLQHAREPSQQMDLELAIATANIDQIYKAVGSPESAPEVNGCLSCTQVV